MVSKELSLCSYPATYLPTHPPNYLSTDLPSHHSQAYTVSLNEHGGGLFEAIIASGGVVALTVGNEGGEGEGHAGCLLLTRAEPAVLEVHLLLLLYYF